MPPKSANASAGGGDGVFTFESMGDVQIDDKVRQALQSSTSSGEAAALNRSEKKEPKSGQCILCDEPKKNGSMCASHKRAYETIYRAANSTEGRKKPIDEAEWNKELDCWNGCEYHVFVQVFGDAAERKKMNFRDAAMAQKILVEFVIANPEGKEKRKVRKFAVNLGQYMHTEGSRQSSEHVDGVRKMDQEIFINLMKSLRGWKEERAMIVWKEFKDDPDVNRDEKGPAWSKMRLWFPSFLFGEDRVEDRKGVFEQKMVARMSKAGKMTEEEISSVKSELSKGFKRPFTSNDAVATMHTALPSNSMTAEGDERERDTTSSLDV